MATTQVQFTLNGELRSVDVDVAAGKTLNEYIRFNSQYTGTKVSCAQGGCGACTVAVARPSHPLKSVPSCLTPLASLHGAAVVTVEGISAADGTPHPVAERLAKMGGSQCGFCTPGMVMQIFSTLSKQDGGKACGEKDLEQCVNGNICRCTGYRPIIDCAKSFAADTTVKSHIDPSVPLGPYDAAAADPKIAFPPSVAPLAGKQWLRPTTVAEAFSAMSSGASPIAGGSAAGIYSDLAMASSSAAGKVWVDLNGVEELAAISCDGSNVKIGSTVTWNGFTDFMHDLAASGKAPNSQALKEFADRTGSIAGAQVRNLGTIGGNIAIARNKGFLSDWVPPLAALGAKVMVIDKSKRAQEEDLLAFVQNPEPFAGLIIAVLLPLPPQQVVFKSFRVAKRSRNAHALVNAGFAASVAGGKLAHVSIVLGAVDPKPCHLKNLERALGHTSAEELQSGLPGVLSSLAEKVSTDLFPLACEFGREQTAHIICGFVVKFLSACFGPSLPKEWQSAEYCLHDMERSSSTLQAFPTPEDLKGPLNKPLPKTSAIDQVTGRAKYTDDVPKPEGTLMGSFILCPEANVVVQGMDLTPAKQMLGDSFHSVVVAEDLSKYELPGGEIMGLGGMSPAYKEGHNPNWWLLLPKGEASPYGGMPVGILLAKGDSPRLLEQAAAACSAKLVLERKGPVMMGDLENCKELTEQMVLTKGKAKAKDVVAAAKEGKNGLTYLSGRFAKKSQAHFYIEGQSCISIPDEGGITCYSANQSPDMIQKAICSMTGLTQHQVCVSMRRVGGGFGGKALYPAYLAALCSDIALKKQLPIRIVPSREQDMSQVGGRHEIEGTWEVAIDKGGKIMALDYDLWFAHSVLGENVQKFPIHAIGANLDSVYTIPSICFTAHIVQQHVPERTAVRGPGHFEGAILAEAVMDGVAANLKMPGHKLRELNMTKGKFNTSGLAGAMVPQGAMDGNCSAALWEALKQKTGYEARAQAVDEFNKANAWKKRGISMTHARYGVFCPPGCSARVDVFKDGTMQIACSGSEIGQGLHVKVGQMVSTVLARALGDGPPMDSIRFIATSTEQTPNGTMTGGSTTSEGNMFAAGAAASELAKRLKPFLKEAKKTKDPSKKGFWFDIIAAAFGTKFMDVLVVPPNLSVVGMHYGLAPVEMMYETYGVAAAEVELDVLTGESRILMSHLLFDVGMSYNPMVDIGQMEGAYIMGCGQMMQEGVDFDHATGKLLTDNTWTYKPPIACDIPETFKVELMDMRKNRLDNPVMSCMMGVMSKMMGAMGVPWKPTKTEKALKSAKAIGEPPLLLCAAPHSALANAVVAATGRPLPDNKMPIPAKPFYLLPMLHAQKPGSGGGPDDASTATGTSVSTQNPGN